MKKRNAITNTSKVPPEVLLRVALRSVREDSDPSSFIEAEEARGQRELVQQASQLPTEGSGRPAWAKMGVIFGPEVADDPIWRHVVLPEGWKLRPTDHSMWSHLLDAKGAIRAKIFYKAAFYDRSCAIHPMPRYQVDTEYKNPDDWDGGSRDIVKDTATGRAVFETPWIPAAPEKLDYSSDAARERRKLKEDQRKLCCEHLKEKYPEHEDPAAYWD